jgi:hypothetical protein
VRTDGPTPGRYIKVMQAPFFLTSHESSDRPSHLQLYSTMMTVDDTTNNDNKSIPYFVLDLGKFHAKALFSVPSDLALQLILHPILCCGSEFVLEIDASTSRSSDIAFLSCHYESADPDATAMEISKRLAKRVGDPKPPGAGLVLGLSR